LHNLAFGLIFLARTARFLILMTLSVGLRHWFERPTVLDLVDPRLKLLVAVDGSRLGQAAGS